MVRDKIYFVSDLHLGSDVLEHPQITERRFVYWLNSIREEAKALYVLGDIFDFWFEYKKTVPRGFTRFFGKIAEMHDCGTEIHFFTGNHDIWMFDYFQSELGVFVHTCPLTTVIDGQVFYLAHGDGLGDDSRLFCFIRSVFHNRICQWLFTHFSSHWGICFGNCWSRQNRSKNLAHPVSYMGEDREALVLYAKKYILLHPETDYLIFGHRHILLDLMLNQKNRVLIIGDWMKYFSYAVFDGQTLNLEQYSSQDDL